LNDRQASRHWERKIGRQDNRKKQIFEKQESKQTLGKEDRQTG
jgi:predicted 2-oxoglutarate/Fe(II)-dependent dioxygenase YbiX